MFGLLNSCAEKEQTPWNLGRVSDKARIIESNAKRVEEPLVSQTKFVVFFGFFVILRVVACQAKTWTWTDLMVRRARVADSFSTSNELWLCDVSV